MKDYRTFVKTQRSLMEQKGNPSSQSPSKSDSSDSIAGLGHGDNKERVMIKSPYLDFINVFTDKLAYDFSSLISSMPSLDKLAISSVEATALKSTLERLSEVDRRRAEQFLKRIEDILVLPSSADRTRRVQQIVHDINGVNVELQRGSRSYDSVQPQNYTPGSWAQWGRR